VDRNEFRLIQTPQAFHGALIKHAYDKKYRKSFTDDASVLEAIGIKINLVEGNYGNIKITEPIDITIATALISSEFPLSF
jgi:2-C-methyl-D-erythritol 4-phosphate cytidylyltransferase